MGQIEQIFLKEYLAKRDYINEKFPLWLNTLRTRSSEYLELIGMPAKGEDVVSLASMIADSSCGSELISVSDFPFDYYKLESDNSQIDNVLTVLDNGVAYGALSLACLDYESIVKKYFDSIADNKSNFLSALNLMFFTEGMFVYVPAGVKVDKPIVLDNIYTACENKNFGRALIILENGAELDLVVRHVASGNFNNHTREIIIGKGAKINITEYVNAEDKSNLVVSSFLKQSTDSQSKTVFVNSGVKSSIMNYKVELADTKADAQIKGLYLAGKNQLSQVNVNMNHLVEDCTSDELIKGLAASNGVGLFAGRIYVAPNAQGTSAAQQSRNILLSDNARIVTRPQLEIYADDVKCSHGATIGQMNQEAVYYMRQRGISELDAKKLQLSGFVNDVISNIDDQQMASYFYEQVALRIEEL